MSKRLLLSACLLSLALVTPAVAQTAPPTPPSQNAGQPGGKVDEQRRKKMEERREQLRTEREKRRGERAEQRKQEREVARKEHEKRRENAHPHASTGKSVAPQAGQPAPTTPPVQ